MRVHEFVDVLREVIVRARKRSRAT
jgi:hypothetical protein